MKEALHLLQVCSPALRHLGDATQQPVKSIARPLSASASKHEGSGPGKQKMTRRDWEGGDETGRKAK